MKVARRQFSLLIETLGAFPSDTLTVAAAGPSGIDLYNVGSESFLWKALPYTEVQDSTGLGFISQAAALAYINGLIAMATVGGQWSSGPGLPSVLTRSDRDQHLNTTTGGTYEVVLGEWILTGNIRGPQGLVGATGPVGPAGTTGAQGPTGNTGERGPTGLTGLTGSIGQTGPPGTTGATGAASTVAGPTGPIGLVGQTGAPGPLGPQGPKGDTGTTGTVGPRGLTGDTGPIGPEGPQGIEGDLGFTGPPGPRGVTGTTGSVGPQGIPGTIGPTGPIGQTGAVGPTGATGPQGALGLTGPQGNTGLTGTTGATGTPGATGAVGLSVLSGNGAPLTSIGRDGEWYVDTGVAHRFYGPKTLGTWGAGVALVGPAGATGPTGGVGPAIRSGTVTPDLPLGQAGEFYINTTTWVIHGPKHATAGWPNGVPLVGPSGASGTPGPIGSTGPQGPQGLQGPTGNAGDPGPQGPSGPIGEYVGSITGTAGQIDVSGSGGTNSQPVISLAQDISADTTPTFAGVILTGSTPLTLSSTTMVANLNAERVGGQTLAQLDTRYALPQSIATTATPTFAAITLTGGTPLVVTSTTLIANLNAERVGGQTLAQLDTRYSTANMGLEALTDVDTFTEVSGHLLTYQGSGWTGRTITQMLASGVTIGGNVTIGGDLTVTGTSYTTASEELTVTAPTITLGGDTAPAADDGLDKGVLMRWHDGTASRMAFMGFDRSTGFLTWMPSVNETGSVFVGAKGTIDALLDWANVSSKPSPVVTVTLTGAVTGSATATLAALSSATASIATSMVGTLPWANISSKPDPVVTVTLTGDVTGTAGATLTDLASGTATIATTIAANSVALGTDTTGNYIATITGTTSQIVVTPSAAAESAAVTLSLPQAIATTSTPTFARLILNQLTGTQPLTVSSTTKVNNLNADMLDDQDGAFYQNASNLITGNVAIGRLVGGYPNITALGNLTALNVTGAASFSATPLVGGLTVWHAGNDGAGSTLDADLLDGLHSSDFASREEIEALLGDLSYAGLYDAAASATDPIDIKFSGVTGQYLQTRVTAAADHSAVWRVECQVTKPTTSYRNASSNPYVVYFTPTQVLVGISTTLGTAYVLPTYSSLTGFPATGEWVQIQGTWDATTDSMLMHWRPLTLGLSLDNDTGWILGVTNTTTWVGRITSTSTNAPWPLGGTGSAVPSFDAQIRRWIVRVNGVTIFDGGSANVTETGAIGFHPTVGNDVAIITGWAPFSTTRPRPQSTPGIALNKLRGPSFEYSGVTDGLADGWTAYLSGAATGVTRTIELTGGHITPRFQRINGTLDASGERVGVYQIVQSLVAGRSYTISAYAKGTIPATARGLLAIYWRNSVGGNLSSNVMPFAPTASWERYSGTFVAPGDTTEAVIYIWAEYLAAGSSVCTLDLAQAALIEGSALDLPDNNVFPPADAYRHGMYWVAASTGEVNFVDEDLSGRYEFDTDDAVMVANGDWLIALDPVLGAAGHEVGTYQSLRDLTFQWIPFSAETFVKSVLAEHTADTQHPHAAAGYITTAITDALYAPVIHSHAAEITTHINLHRAEVDPHPLYLNQLRGDNRYMLLTATLPYEPQGAILEHKNELDPHSQYLTPLEGNITYSGITHDHPEYSNDSHTHSPVFEIISTDGAASSRLFMGSVAPASPAIGDLWIQTFNISLQPPLAPTGLISSVTPTSIVLTWNTFPLEAEQSSVIVERSANGTTGWAAVLSDLIAPFATTHTDTGLAERTQFWYRVRGGNATGQGAWATTTATTGNNPPPTPTGLTNSSITPTSMRFNWAAVTPPGTDPLHATEPYEVFRNGVSQGYTTGLFWDFTGLSENSSYTWSVRVKDNLGLVSATASLVGTTSNAAPPAPGSLSWYTWTHNSAHMQWAAVGGISDFQCYQVFLNGSYVANTNATSWNFTGLSPSTNYTFGVRSVDWSSATSAISTLSGTTSPNPDTTPPAQSWVQYFQPFNAYGELHIQFHTYENVSDCQVWRNQNGAGWELIANGARNAGFHSVYMGTWGNGNNTIYAVVHQVDSVGNIRYGDQVAYTLEPTPKSIGPYGSNSWRPTNGGEWNAGGGYKLYKGYYSNPGLDSRGLWFYGYQFSDWNKSTRTITGFEVFVNREGCGSNSWDDFWIYLHDMPDSPGTTSYWGGPPGFYGEHYGGQRAYNSSGWSSLPANWATELCVGTRRGLGLYGGAYGCFLPAGSGFSGLVNIHHWG